MPARNESRALIYTPMAARIAENLEEIRRSEYTEWDLIEDWDHQPRKRNCP